MSINSTTRSFRPATARPRRNCSPTARRPLGRVGRRPLLPGLRKRQPHPRLPTRPTNPFPVLHYCFRVSETALDGILARIRPAASPTGEHPARAVDAQVNTRHGGRIVYWNEPDGHVWEALNGQLRPTSPLRTDAPPRNRPPLRRP